MPSRAKEVFFNLTIVFISLFISLSVCEIFLRLMPANSVHKKEPAAVKHTKNTKYEPDKFLGWKIKSNAKAKNSTSEFSTTQVFNSRGIRGPEYSYSKDENEYRILVLGDSFTEAFTVEFNQAFSQVLKRNLNKDENIYHDVISTGVAGYSTDQEFLFFQNEGKKYNQNLTILMFHDNDVFYNNRTYAYTKSRHKPMYTLADGKLVLTNVPIKFISKKTGKITEVKKSLSEEIEGWIHKKSYLYRNVHNLYGYMHGVAIEFGFIKEPHKNYKVPADFSPWKKVYGRDIQNAWEITEAIISELKKENEKTGSKLLVFYIPTRACIYRDEWESTKRFLSMSNEGWDIEKVGTELGAICKRNNIDYINPVKYFKLKSKELTKEGKRLYFLNDSHWTIEAHKIAGDMLGEYIKHKL